LRIAAERKLSLTPECADAIAIYLEIEKKREDAMSLVLRDLSAKVRPCLDGDHIQELYLKKCEMLNINDAKLKAEKTRGVINDQPAGHVSPAAKEFFFAVRFLSGGIGNLTEDQKSFCRYVQRPATERACITNYRELDSIIAREVK